MTGNFINQRSFCVFEYLYRDASNYKAVGMLLLSGQLSSRDENFIRQKLDASEYFVAEQVGIPSLYRSLWELSGGPTQDDHAFHEFIKLRIATEEEIKSLEPHSSLDELIKAFQSVTKWDVTLSPNVESWL